MTLRDTGLERATRYRAIMNDPILKAEYLAKIRAKVAAEMEEYRKKLFAEAPVGATHYETWEYGYKSFYKLIDGKWYLCLGDNEWEERGLYTSPPHIPEQYLKLE